MITVNVRDNFFEIRPVTQEDLEAVLGVYKQCEDFLALGPVASASMEMVLKDLEISKNEGGIFCGIYTAGGKMIGVVDYVSHNYQEDPQVAFLSLLMIAAPFRNQGIGEAVVDGIENEIRKDSQVNVILSGVQVNNPQAVRFWQMKGYRIVSEPRLHPDQTTAVDLRKDLQRVIAISKDFVQGRHKNSDKIFSRSNRLAGTIRKRVPAWCRRIGYRFRERLHACRDNSA
jgi:ribosomal protein S18 acetylase RimI-like enzyme